MIYKIKIVYSLIFIISFFLLTEINSVQVAAQTNLKIKGNVIGYSNYSSIVIKSFGCCFVFPTDSLLVRVTNTKKRKVNSKFIIVKFPGLNKDLIDKKFGIDKILTFSLERINGCDETIQDLMYYVEEDEDRNIILTPRDFTFTPGIMKNSLPVKKVLPCYFSRKI